LTEADPLKIPPKMPEVREKSLTGLILGAIIIYFVILADVIIFLMFTSLRRYTMLRRIHIGGGCFKEPEEMQ